ARSTLARRLTGEGTAPRSGIDVCDRLRERPVVSAEILGVVLPFAVGIVRGRPQDASAAPHRPVVMAVRVLDAHENRVCQRISPVTVALTALHHDERAVPEDELRAVVADPQALRKP